MEDRQVSGPDRAKRAAALRALDRVEAGMTLGLGTGSTAAFMVSELGARVAAGLSVTGVPTSSATRTQAEALGIPLTTLDAAGPLDLTIDGADEIDPHLRLIKGGGGALLQEKIVAAASRRMIVISDASKQVATLGRFPLPVEIVRFGWGATAAAIEAVLGQADVDSRILSRRRAGSGPFVTDEGHYILDLALDRIGDPAALDTKLRAIPGVVETGLFLDLCTGVVIGHPDGSTEELDEPEPSPGV